MKTFFRIVIGSLLSVYSITSVFAQEKTYQQEIDTWHKKRVESLLSPNGWVNLEGLFWLQPGRNAFGSHAANDIVYANIAFPKLAGYFEWEKSKVQWITEAGVKVTILDSAISAADIFEEGKQPVLLSLGSFRWNIIKRDDKVGIRFRNLESPRVKEFKGINRFPVKEQWRVTAHLEAVPKASVLITNVLGQTKPEDSPGKLVFTLEGKKYQLDPITEGNQLFILFGDATSGKETYPTGRFLYAQLPDANGNTILDFNKAFNPPCAFSDFATCPLPPRQNILPIAISAGEKDYHPGIHK
jgi:hypothetical protein